MADHQPSFEEHLGQRGVSRRDFLKFCGLMAATLMLPAIESPRIAHALGTKGLTSKELAAMGVNAAAPNQYAAPASALAATRPPLVWLEFQGCTGDTESFLHASNPNVSQILLETLSVNYHETLMVPSGALATKSLNDTIANYPGQYLVVIEGSIPTGAGGAYCTIGGRSAQQIATEVCSQAAAVITTGTCSSSGGISAAQPNPTGAVGVKQLLPGLSNHLSLPGCPMNVVNLTAVIVHYLTYASLPPMDYQNRPLFAYGNLIHDVCPRREHYDQKEFVLAWGDEGHRAGWCLHEMGCRGPETRANCPQVMWNEGTNWPIGAGHPCVGCAGVNFWDAQTPFYKPLPG
jgi:hydrogenase small subunit